MAASVLAHVGLHKTATTWLQDTLFQPAAAQGAVLYCDDREVIRGSLGKPELDCFDAKATRARFAAHLGEGFGQRDLVISDEMIAGIPFHHKFRGRIKLTRLRETFPEAAVLITIRAQGPLIYSAWGHYLRTGYTSPLAAFVQRPQGADQKLWDPILDRDAYDYMQLLDYCEGLFGAGRVLMMPMEWMTKDPQGFVDRLRAATGIALPLPNAGTTRRAVNTAWSHPALNVLRHANRLGNVDARWQTGAAARWGNRLAARVDRLVPAATAKRRKAAALARIDAALGDDYRASNRALADRLGLDLAALGYRV